MSSTAQMLPHLAPGGLRILDSCEDCAVGLIDGGVLLVWRTRVVPRGVRWLARALSECAKAGPGTRCLFHTVILPDCQLTTSTEVRDELADLLKRREHQISAAAITYEAEGFRGTLARSIITAINLASGSRFPARVFSTLPDAADWLAGQDPTHRVTATRLVLTSSALRDAF